MANHTSPNNLQTALENRCERVFKQKSAVLFRRGEKAFGLFLILSGKVSLDFGADTPYTRCYGPGALMGLPATLTKRNYCMTATVTENAELGFLSPEALDLLLREDPALCQELVAILGEKMVEVQIVKQGLLDKDSLRPQKSRVV